MLEVITQTTETHLQKEHFRFLLVNIPVVAFGCLLTNRQQPLRQLTLPLASNQGGEANNTNTVTLPIAFSTTHYVKLAIHYGTSITTNVIIDSNNMTNSSFKILKSNTGVGDFFYWLTAGK